jgi:hypothetical protein
MTRRSFAARPGGPDTWRKAADDPRGGGADATAYAARLTIDVTSELRGRIKITAFRRGQTVADMLRELLAGAFPAEGDAQ